MKAIWKFRLEPGVQIVRMPQGARLSSVGQQHGRVVLWAIVDPEAPTVDRRFLVLETGRAVEHRSWAFIGTVQVELGAEYYVMHVFDLGEMVPQMSIGHG